MRNPGNHHHDDRKRRDNPRDASRHLKEGNMEHFIEGPGAECHDPEYESRSGCGIAGAIIYAAGFWTGVLMLGGAIWLLG